MPSYVEAEVSGPYVDVTIHGPYKTVPLEPVAARALARELEEAADEIDNPPPSDALLPGLEVVLTEPTKEGR